MKVLLATTNFVLKSFTAEFKANSFSAAYAENGKVAQTMLAKEDVEFFFIDIEIKNHGFLPLIKFARINSPKAVIYLFVPSKEHLKSIDLSEKELREIGISKVLYAPFDAKELIQVMQKHNPYKSWQSATPTEPKEIDESKEQTLSDQLFTSVSIESFSTHNVSILDIYIRLGKDRYLKLINRGEGIDPTRIKKYSEKHQVTQLYFKTEDRASYINYVNSLLKKMSEKSHLSKVGGEKIVTSITEKYLEEVQTRGLSPAIYEEGLSLCDNIGSLIENNSALTQLLNQLPSNTKNHQVLTTFYTGVIAINEEWVGKKTLMNILMGSMVHNIGLLKLDWYNHETRPQLSQMTDAQKGEFLRYPEKGYEMLADIPHIPTAVKQIVLQHCEYEDGTGYPIGLRASRIYPLAKMVGLASYFSNIILTTGLSPKEALKIFIPDPEQTGKFQGQLIKSLVKGFTKK
tara:strand:- start:35886 stop:37262 length:1377 start_codon:yes stop_codon:yes gene_type:complete